MEQYEGEVTITESTLNENTAQEGSSGAIYNYDEKTFEIKDCN
ncbi:hypothetical protein [Methanobrevibacter millerae]|uniref:Adhesin-like protein n=1 Tax=Methanobrevibacter millerae TaxID=230361 RepID=A0A1G5X7C1_9EURY|nr:hypothetical protein [Methanobrevibacter millerae]SDA66152.1 hypothetical protein SAMN02910315_02008 [Methanobrevibacter millerae]